MTAPDRQKSTGEMMSDILGNVSNLVRNETDMARAEVGESLAKAKSSIAAIAVGYALAIAGLNVLAAAAVTLVVEAGVRPPWATAIVGFSFLLIALAIFILAKSALNQIGFVPTRAARNLQRDVAVFKDSFNEK